MIINKQIGGVYLIDPTIADPTTSIVKVLSLSCVATSQINTAVPSRIVFSDCNGKPTGSIVVDADLQYQDDGGSPTYWTGTIDELLQKLNNEYFIQASGGGGGNVVVTNNTDPSTFTQQEEQTSILVDLEDNTKRKFIGTTVELASDSGGDWQGFPVESAELILSINGVETSYPMDDVESMNNQQLVEQLNKVQNVLVFDWVRDSIDIVFNGVGVSSPEVTGIKIEDNNTGTLEYTSFTASTDEETGAVQQMAVLMQKQLQLLQDLNSKTPKLAATISLSYTGNLEYNLTADADIDGKTIPLGSFGDISSIQDLDAGNVNYRFDSGTPNASYPTINGNRAFDKLTNVDFNTFRIKAGAGGAAYTIIINLYK